MPVLNGAATIGDQLRALAGQVVDAPFEVVVADNGSTDGTRAVVERHAPDVPGLRLVDASRRRGPAAARNVGVAAAAGDLFAFCDADDVVGPGWLAAMAAAAAQHHFVAGSIDLSTLAAPGSGAATSPLWAPTVGSFAWLRYALGANMAVSRTAFRDVGGFAEDLLAGEDVDLSWRLQLAGYPLHHEPAAVVAKRPRPTGRGTALQHLDYGVHDVLLYKRLRQSGMPRRPAPAQVRLYGWLAVNAWRVVAGGPGRATWTVAASAAAGRALGSIRHRTLFL